MARAVLSREEKPTKYCPNCKGLVDTRDVQIAPTMSLMKCAKCGKNLGQVSAGVIIWFR